MIRSEKSTVLNTDVNRIWDIITDNKDYFWRSDVAKIEIIDENHFIEYTNTNFLTHFIITNIQPCQRYEFDIENQNLRGHFTAILNVLGEDSTQITLIEEIEVSSPIMRLLAKLYLKKQQNRYIKDLKKKIFTTINQNT